MPRPFHSPPADVPYSAPSQATARVIQVIETTIARRGLGKDASDPVRMVTQYWTLDGKLITEIDPTFSLRISPEQASHLR